MSKGKHRNNYNKRGTDALFQIIEDSLIRIEEKIDEAFKIQNEMKITCTAREFEIKNIDKKVTEHIDSHKKKGNSGRISKITGL